jgi:8-oxo-dGTP pyrophosphatase MutT (NUDIX family)
VITAAAGEPKGESRESTWADRPLAERIGPMNPSTRAFAVVLSRDGKILLSHRTELESCEGWQLPGGLRTGYESAEANVLREVREEAGVSMEKLEVDWFHVDEKVGTAYFRFRYSGTSADQFEVKDPDADFGLPFSDKSAWFALDSEPAKCLIFMQENRFKLARNHVEKFFGLAK